MADRVGVAELTSATLPDPRHEREQAFLLTREIEAELASHPELSWTARNVEVSVTEGIVTFRGAVPGAEAKQALDDVTRAVPGVVDTLNKVEISPSRAEDPAEIDDRIAFSLQRSLMFHPAVAGRVDRVTIDVTNGGVTFRGTTPEQNVNDAVLRIARGTPGVTNVTSHLDVDER